ncbi:hypothetical protein [Streptomyces sp. NBC_00576]|uniref:hypothetical protein n=1 Tax=Streptomyces sp. NBC_00576 TaxID=2903665 RepID=UPI002E801F59|nr:hypothetical protein [Streptomyces sp. NBC_00576]WUB74221.1 hypothetical protein OG734_31465 [Streptomyces sp. NBC_00576]
MTEHRYSAADIEVLEFDAAVRKWPGMYFGVGPGSPKLPANLLSAVGRHVLHPATSVAGEHALRGLVTITSDSSFTVAMDQPHAWGVSDAPDLGYFGSLLRSEWWLLAATAAISHRVTVEMWCAGRGLRQDLSGIRPCADPQEFHPVEGSGTRVSFALDPAYVGQHFVLPTDLEDLDLHGPDCLEPAGPGYVLIKDVRHGQTAPEILHR